MIRPPSPPSPGVYVAEGPTGSGSIVGTNTSVTAFVGRFASGPVGMAVLVSSYADAVAQVGGIVADAPVTYALRDFFANGGLQAVIVRQYSAPSGPAEAGDARPASVPPGTAAAHVGGVDLMASSPGAWGNRLQVLITQTAPAVAADYAPLGLLPADLFDVTVRCWPEPQAAVVSETISAVTVKPGVRRIDAMLAQSSRYVRLAYDTFPTSMSAGATGAPLAADATNVFAGGEDSGPLRYEDYTDSVNGYKAVLERDSAFQLLVLPPDSFTRYVDTRLLSDAAAFCRSKLAFYIIEPFVNSAPNAPDLSPWATLASQGEVASIDISSLGVTGPESAFAAIYFPWANFPGSPSPYPLSGILAGIYATTDATEGVWKAPAGVNAAIPGTTGLALQLSDADVSSLNSQGINALRQVSNIGTLVWGARTMNGADAIGGDYKYIPVRRLTSYIEASVSLGIQWAVFEPNDETLWSSLRSAIGTFLNELFGQGALAGSSAKDAYFVQCDSTTTSPADQAAGVVNVVIGIAPLRPAEFIVLYVQQVTGSTS